jgi:hypothetical protein
MCDLFCDHLNSVKIPVGSWKSPEQGEYRTRDGRAYFTFNFVKTGFLFARYEIDIVSQPSYGNRSQDLFITRRLHSDRGGYKVDLDDEESQASSLDNAKKRAGEWAEYTWNYICGGEDCPVTVITEATRNQINSGISEVIKHQEMQIFQKAFDEMCNTVGKKPAETGGILLGTRRDYSVQKFIFDPHGSRTAGGYDPDVNYLNKVIKKEWETNQLELVGFLHSHPRGVSRLSGDWGNNIGDLGYIKAIFGAIPALDRFLVPIMYSSYDGGERVIFPYIAPRNNPQNYQKAPRIINEHGQELHV